MMNGKAQAPRTTQICLTKARDPYNKVGEPCDTRGAKEASLALLTLEQGFSNFKVLFPVSE